MLKNNANVSEPNENKPTGVEHVELSALLEEDIIFGRRLPRERLIENDLMSKFGVKRHSVRSALKELAIRNLVVQIPNRGYSVADLKSEDLEQIFQIRSLLEEYAARIIPIDSYLEVSIELERIQTLLEKALKKGDLSKVNKFNNEFHRTLISACENHFLVEDILRYRDMSHLIRSYAIGNPEFLKQSIADHLDIIFALQNKKPNALASLCIKHLYSAKTAYEFVENIRNA